ncbi:hypothetical protein CICLE_v10007041mg, partial [Citrus x clementina]
KLHRLPSVISMSSISVKLSCHHTSLLSCHKCYNLQLALGAPHHRMVCIFAFFLVNVVGASTKRCDVNVVGASTKRRDILQEKHAQAVIKALDDGELSSGRGLNQEVTLKRYVDTCWGSHYGTLLSIITMFPSIINMPEIISNEGNSKQRFQATMLLKSMQSFDFVFSLLLMKNILGFAHELSQALQKKNQDIVNAMKLIEHDIDVPNMDDLFRTQGRSQRKAQKITNLHCFRVELFYAILDMQLKELSIFYPNDFSLMDLVALETQFDVYIMDVSSNNKFSGLKWIGELARKLVETKKDQLYSLVYLLVTLALILPIAAVTVERAFSAMNFVKNRLRNWMRHQWLNDSLVVFIKKDIFCSLDNEVILQRFQHMKPRRRQL